MELEVSKGLCHLGNTSSLSCKLNFPVLSLTFFRRLLTIYFFSGALCCAWGIVIFLFLPDSPVTAPFLNQRDRRRAVERVRSNQTGIENKQLKPYQIKEAFIDYKLYLFFLLGVV